MIKSKVINYNNETQNHETEIERNEKSIITS